MFFGKQKRRKLLITRRIVGRSMVPHLPPDTYIIATGAFKEVREGDVVVVLHNSMEKIKRVSDVRSDTVFVVGDNLSESTDSRQFGWICKDNIVARVMWPR